jgi:hypothetical protein
MKGTYMKPQKDPKCGVCATNPFERNNYFYGKQFTVRDLVQEQSYFNDKRYLINRMVLGWGVVCGLEVYWDPKRRRIVVTPGMALDCCGHEIIVCQDRCLSIDENDDDCCLDDKPKTAGKFVLCLEYDECCTEPIELPAVGCDESGRTEHNRIRDGFKLRLKRWEDACVKEPPEKVWCPDHYKHPVDGQANTPNCKTEDIHHYLCRQLKHCAECEACDCVVLATVTIEAEQPTPPAKDPKQIPGKTVAQSPQPETFKDPIVDSCTNRKLVYNNSLLFNLINCNHGDLPHIVDFSWRTDTYPKREVTIDRFIQMMRDGLKVYFDKPMNADSLNAHTFIVSYLHRDTGTGAFIEKRIPVQEIRAAREGDCYTATFIATERWIKHELDADDSEIIAGLPNVEPGVDIEITLRGSRIWSDEGKGLDGDYLADKLPTGNGTQGGDFVDWFRVMPPAGKQPKGTSYKGKF